MPLVWEHPLQAALANWIEAFRVQCCRYARTCFGTISKSSAGCCRTHQQSTHQSVEFITLWVGLQWPSWCWSQTHSARADTPSEFARCCNQEFYETVQQLQDTEPWVKRLEYSDGGQEHQSYGSQRFTSNQRVLGDIDWAFDKTSQQCVFHKATHPLPALGTHDRSLSFLWTMQRWWWRKILEDDLVGFDILQRYWLRLIIDSFWQLLLWCVCRRFAFGQLTVIILVGYSSFHMRARCFWIVLTLSSHSWQDEIKSWIPSTSCGRMLWCQCTLSFPGRTPPQTTSVRC